MQSAKFSYAMSMKSTLLLIAGKNAQKFVKRF